MRYIIPYVSTLLCFLMLDALWLGWIAQPVYQREMGPLMAESPDWLAAGIFYPLFIAALLYFAVFPASGAKGRTALIKGFLFGLTTYGTYELTNKAVLAGWSWGIVPIDMLWGACLCACAAWVGWKSLGIFPKKAKPTPIRPS